MSYTGTLAWTGTTAWNDTEGSGGGVAGENGWIGTTSWVGTVTFTDQAGGAGGEDITIVALTLPENYWQSSTPGTQTHLTDLGVPANNWGSTSAVVKLVDALPAANNTTCAEPDNNWQNTAPSALWSGTDTYL